MVAKYNFSGLIYSIEPGKNNGVFQTACFILKLLLYGQTFNFAARGVSPAVIRKDQSIKIVRFGKPKNLR